MEKLEQCNDDLDQRGNNKKDHAGLSPFDRIVHSDFVVGKSGRYVCKRIGGLFTKCFNRSIVYGNLGDVVGYVLN